MTGLIPPTETLTGQPEGSDTYTYPIDRSSDGGPGRLILRQSGVASIRPQSPTGLKYEGGLLLWSAPSRDNVFTHFRIRIGSDSAAPMQVPASQTSYQISSGTRFWVSSYNEPADQESVPAQLTAAGSYAGRSAVVYYTATANPTNITNPFTPQDGDHLTILFAQDGTGGRYPGWPVGFKNGPSATPPVTTTANTLSAITFVGYAGSWYFAGIQTGLATL